MALWQTKGTVNFKRTAVEFSGGLNKYTDSISIKDNELSDIINMDYKNYPTISTIDSLLAAYAQIADFNGLGLREAYPHVHNGTIWQEWNGSAWANIATGLADAESSIIDFNTTAKRYTCLFNATDQKSYDGTSVADLTDAPNSNLVAVDDYRIFCLLGTTLYWSAENSITDWTTLDDAGSEPIVSMEGSATAIASYKDLVICFSDKTQHILAGNDPYDFEFTLAHQNGCVGRKAITELDGLLYYMDYGKIMIFNNGTDYEISLKVNDILDDLNTTYKSKVVLKGFDDNLYVSLPTGTATTNDVTLIYNKEDKVWSKMDTGFQDFFTVDNKFYGVLNDGYVKQLESKTQDSTTVWSMITKCFVRQISTRKTLREIWILVDCPTGSSLTVSYSDSLTGTFTTIKSISSDSDVQNTRIKIPVTQFYNLNKYRLKFSGVGYCNIYSIELSERSAGR